MQQLMYVPPGGSPEDMEHSVILAAKEPFLLTTVSGLGGMEADVISSEIVGMDGELYQGMRKGARPVKCTVTVAGRNRSDMYSEKLRLIGLLRKPPGKKTGTLYYTNDNITVRIGAVPVMSGDFKKRIINYNEAEIEFYCPDPDWQSPNETQVSITCEEGIGLSFPTELNNIILGRTFNELDIDYTGTAPTPVTIAISGPTETPVITNETVGKSIRLTQTLNSGELLIIRTQKGQKSVKLFTDDSETDAFGYLSPTSQFWNLIPGVNHIVYGDGGQAQTSVQIKFNTRYEGV